MARDRKGNLSSQRPKALAVDAITTEVIRHGLDSAADQMRIALRRMAFSTLLYEAQDFACALYDRQVRLLAQAQALPLFLGTLGFSIEAALNKIGGEKNLEPGDVIFSTYGYDIGSHQQDAVIVAPGFFEGELVGYVAVKAHQMDIGAKDPYCTDTVDIFQEGTIFPSVKLYRRGVLQQDIYRTLLANSRIPKVLVGDLNAQIGAAKSGLNAFDALLKRHGPERFLESAELMFDHGEAVVRNMFEAIPDGRYVGQGAMDSNGITDELLPFEIGVEIEGSDVIIDFSNAPPQQPGPINCPLPTTVSASRIAIMALASGGGALSANEGHFRPIEVRTREGTLFHPVPPAPIYMYAWPAIQAIEVIHKSLSDAMPEAVPAGSGGELCAFISWGTSDDGSPWAAASAHACGMGATHDGDARGPLLHIGCSGQRSTPCEVFEARHPFLVEKFEFAPDSGGIGRFRGGLGIDIHYRALREMYLTLPWDRTKTPPWGLHGGKAGRANHFRLRYADGTSKDYHKVTRLLVPKGAVLEVHIAGGGGFGPPEERDPNAILEDILEGYVVDEQARKDYPLAFDGGGPQLADRGEFTSAIINIGG